MILFPSRDVKCAREPFEIFLATVKEILANNGTYTPVIIDENKNSIENNRVCDALKRIGTKYIPVIYGEKDVEPVRKVSLEELGFYEDIRPSTLKVFNSAIELLVGSWPTPLVKLNLKEIFGDIDIYVKLEGFNPFSMSVKDRIAWYMIVSQYVENPSSNMMLYEATSTNTGLALALIGNIFKMKTKLFIPAPVQKTSEAVMKMAGAEVIRRSDKSLTVELIDDVKEISMREGGINLNQFENDYNFEAHLRFTAKELDLQLKEIGKRPLAIVGGLGTSGHLAALSTYFKSRYGKGVKIIGAQPALGTSIQGIRRVESGMKWINFVDIDSVVDVHPKNALEEVRRVATSSGLLLGPSTGAAIHAAILSYKDGMIPNEDGVVVVVSPDMGVKYGEYFLAWE